MPVTLDVNPLREGLPRQRVAEPCVMLLFGGTGDLARRKLMPALFRLYCEGFLPAGFAIVGIGRTDYTDEVYRDEMRKAVEQAGELVPGSCAWETFAEGVKYVSADYDDPEGYRRIAGSAKWADENRGTSGNRLIYMAVPPAGFSHVTENLMRSGLAKSEVGWTRIIVEKPFGFDLESAKKLNSELLNAFDEDQIYRIDHYLGKETVQNILVLRFANSILEPIWNQRYVDHVQITIAESIGIEGRGDYYDNTGALRDMVQNHGLQLISLTAMEPPASLAPNDIRNEKIKVLRNIRRVSKSDVAHCAVRGQYGSGFLLGQPVPAYRAEPNVDPRSNTETFVALQLYIDNWRWAGVPFYLRTGKRLPRRSTEIAIQFKEIPDVLFRKVLPEQVEPNVLAINVQPDEGITLKTQSKSPGLELRMRPVHMEFRYGSSFETPVPEAYERLLTDALLGDQSLFARNDAVEEAWEIVTPILEYWRRHEPKGFPNYIPGTWGPDESMDLMERSGRRWRRI